MSRRFQFNLRTMLAAIALTALCAAIAGNIVRHIHEQRLAAARNELRLAEAIAEHRLGTNSDWPPNSRAIQSRARVARQRLNKLEGR